MKCHPSFWVLTDKHSYQRKGVSHEAGQWIDEQGKRVCAEWKASGPASLEEDRIELFHLGPDDEGVMQCGYWVADDLPLVWCIPSCHSGAPAEEEFPTLPQNLMDNPLGCPCLLQYQVISARNSKHKGNSFMSVPVSHAALSSVGISVSALKGCRWSGGMDWIRELNNSPMADATLLQRMLVSAKSPSTIYI
eukprot:5761915-Amphidinium_carterae.2